MSAGQARPARLFHGWLIVLTAFLGNFMSSGTNFYVFNVFIPELERLLHCTRTELSWVFTLNVLFNSGAAIFLGFLIQRFGVKPIYLAGTLVAGSSYLVLSRIDSYLAFVILVGMILPLGNAGQGGLSGNTVVSRWFIRKRGMALGMATVGMSLCGAVMPVLCEVLLRGMGLRGAFVVLGIMIFAVVWPPVLLFIREKPEDVGLSPDGEPRPGMDAGASAEGVLYRERVWTSREAMRTGTYWKIVVCYVLAMTGVLGIMLQLMPHFLSIGFSRDKAVLLLSVTALIGALGKFAWGSFTDRFDIRRVIAASFIGQMIGLMVMINWPTAFGAYVFMVVYGFCMGGVLSTCPAIIARTYGAISYPVVAGTMSFFFILQGLAHPIMGQSYDRFGSYLPAFTLFSLYYGIAAVVILTIPVNRSNACTSINT